MVWLVRGVEASQFTEREAAQVKPVADGEDARAREFCESQVPDFVPGRAVGPAFADDRTSWTSPHRTQHVEPVES